MAKKRLAAKLLKLIPKPTTHIVFAVAAIGVVALVLSVFVPPIRRINYKTIKPITKQVIKPAAKPKPAQTAPPKTTTPPPPTPVAVAPKPVYVPKSTPKPVIKPAPSSSVSNLSSTSGSTSTSTTTSSSTTSGTSTSGGTTSTSTTQPPNNPAPDYTSSNWSGFVAASAKYTTISGTWQQPNPTGNGTNTMADATWIGIGGVTTSDLIQVGTDNTVSPSGTVSSSAFYEMLPNAAINISSINLSPGDTIQASINETSTNEWKITLSDTTSNQTFTLNVSYSSALSSAEWIEEDPSDVSGNLLPFDNYGTLNITNAETTANGVINDLTQSGAQSIAMVNSSNQIISSPSAIGSDGASFSLTRENF